MVEAITLCNHAFYSVQQIKSLKKLLPDKDEFKSLKCKQKTFYNKKIYWNSTSMKTVYWMSIYVTA